MHEVQALHDALRNHEAALFPFHVQDSRGPERRRRDQRSGHSDDQGNNDADTDETAALDYDRPVFGEMSLRLDRLMLVLFRDGNHQKNDSWTTTTSSALSAGSGSFPAMTAL